MSDIESTCETCIAQTMPLPAGRRPHISEAYVLDEWHDLIEEGRDCAICGDAFEVGQRAIWVPAGYGPKNAIVPAHLGCAVNGDEVELAPHARG